MKKLFSILAIALMVGCTPKEEDPQCDCGVVTEVVVIGPQRYQTKIKNDCTGIITEYLLINQYEVGWTKCN
jgi:hypothetical protein